MASRLSKTDLISKAAMINDRLKAQTELILPLLTEAKNHPALWEKINGVKEATPDGVSIIPEWIVAAIVEWMKDRRVA